MYAICMYDIYILLSVKSILQNTTSLTAYLTEDKQIYTHMIVHTLLPADMFKDLPNSRLS